MLTTEEKKRIAEDMGWCYSDIFEEYYFVAEDVTYIKFSLNDASLVVEELGKSGKYFLFENFAYRIWLRTPALATFASWLLTMNSNEATNFFRSYAEWLKEGK